MADSKLVWKTLSKTPVRWLTGVLVLHAALFYSLSFGENPRVGRPLAELPAQFGEWSKTADGVVEQAVRDVLRADDLLTRRYRNPNHQSEVDLFIAFFQSQRTGQAPHSPKNCLPGSGWVPSDSGVVRVTVPGESTPIEVNRYLVSKGENTSVVYYWYQSNRRVIASEYSAKLYLVLDAIQYNRTDTSLVRAVVPVVAGRTQASDDTVVDFIQAMFPTVRAHLPGL